VHQLSDGVPRVVNVICERALVLAREAGASEIDESTVLEAARQLGVEPPPPRISAVRIAVAVLLVLALFAAGAAAAAYAFSDELAMLISG
jgi:general secretion pathway protein A